MFNLHIRNLKLEIKRFHFTPQFVQVLCFSQNEQLLSNILLNSLYSDEQHFNASE